MKLINILMATLLCVISIPQDIKAENMCNQLLSHGIYDFYKYNSDVTSKRLFKEWYCDVTKDKETSKSDLGFDLSIPIDGIPAAFGITQKGEEYSNWHHQFCSDTTDVSSFTQSVSHEIQRINKELITAWTSCVNRKGFYAYLVMMEPRKKQFLIKLQFDSHSPLVREVNIISFKNSDNIRCQDVPQKIETGTVEKVVCSRTDDEDGFIAINANYDMDREGGIIKIAATPKPKPHNPLEKSHDLFVGTVEGKNLGIVSSNTGHLGANNKPLGYSIKVSDAAHTQLYVGGTPNRNAGFICKTIECFGGKTTPYGWTIKESYKKDNFIPIYVNTKCQGQEGIISTHYASGGCKGEHIGYILPFE